MHLRGWVELEGRKIKESELEQMLSQDPRLILTMGGEFHLTWEQYIARDHFGIIPGEGLPGCLMSGMTCLGSISPHLSDQSLQEAIGEAVTLRSDEGIVALSGGVDSTLIAALAKRECLVVGTSTSHDLLRARDVARGLGLICIEREIGISDVEEALSEVLAVIPHCDPLNTGIALTQYFITQEAAARGHHRVITGQGADELFGGYSRYLRSTNLQRDLERDLEEFKMQITRDQAVANLAGVSLSLPYMDLRVVRAAQKIPADLKVREGKRKIPLRSLAEFTLPSEYAWYEKKAMQYGSGTWGILKKLAHQNGYKKSMQAYIDQVRYGH